MKWSISAANKAELFEVFESVGTSVPLRTERRDKDAEELYSLKRYLLPLAEAGLLHYPLSIVKGESPDFDLDSPDERSGLEITKATTEHFEEDLTHFDRGETTRHYYSEPTNGVMLLSRAGWAGDSAEHEWAAHLLTAIERKAELIPTYKRRSICDLLIYDNTPTAVVNLKHAVEYLCSRLPQSETRKRAKSLLRTISVIRDPYLIHDIEGDQILLTFKLAGTS